MGSLAISVPLGYTDSMGEILRTWHNLSRSAKIRTSMAAAALVGSGIAGGIGIGHTTTRSAPAWIAEGTASCPAGYDVANIWIGAGANSAEQHADPTSGYSEIPVPPHQSQVAYSLGIDEKMYAVHVGCGGDYHSWGAADYSGLMTAGSEWNVTCDLGAPAPVPPQVTKIGSCAIKPAA